MFIEPQPRQVFSILVHRYADMLRRHFWCQLGCRTLGHSVFFLCKFKYQLTCLVKEPGFCQIVAAFTKCKSHHPNYGINCSLFIYFEYHDAI